MKKPPCIRGLIAFKKGCPQRSWNGEDGCPAWVEVEMKSKNGEKITIKECLDLHMARLHFGTNMLLEGNQQAIETFRNNMSIEGSPKPDPAILALANIIDSSQKRLT